jgi:hypothetical protein
MVSPAKQERPRRIALNPLIVILHPTFRAMLKFFLPRRSALPEFARHEF